MTLSDYVTTLRRGWAVVLATVVVALLCAGAVVVRQPDVYTSTTRLFVAAALGEEDPEELYQRNRIAIERVVSYVEVARGGIVADRVKDELGVSPNVSVAAVPNTVVLEITATASDPQQAADVARAYAKVVPATIAEIGRAHV